MRYIFLVLAVLSLSCATAHKLSRLQLGLSKTETAQRIGNPITTRGSIVNKYGETIEVLEYGFYKTGNDAFYGVKTYYWLFYVDGVLVQWGEAGDWQKTVDAIYEIKFTK